MLRLAGSFPRLPPPVLLPRAHRSFSPALAASPLSRRRALLLLLSSFGIGPLSCYRGPSFAAMAAAAPPVAKKVPRQLVEHGDVRVDNYYWLRDDSRSDPDVLAHLRAENDYTAPPSCLVSRGLVGALCLPFPSCAWLAARVRSTKGALSVLSGIS